VLNKTLSFVESHPGLADGVFAKLRVQVESKLNPILERIAA
jgi:hypothetical protein